MLKIIFKIIKKIIFYSFLLYGFNLVAAPLNIAIPINMINIGILTIFSFPALFALIFIKIVIY